MNQIVPLCISGKGVVTIKRKIVQHGPSTLIISLPSRWIKKYDVHKGDELEVAEQENTLLISTETQSKPSEVEIDITGLDRTTIMYVLRSLYRLGYDTVKIRFEKGVTTYQRDKKEVNILSVIHTEVNRLVGYEIVQEREKSCIIKDLQDTSMKDFDQVLRRIFLLLIDATNDFIQGARTNNMNLLETIEEKHDTITKFISYCLRLLNKKGYPVPRKTNYYYHIIASLDRVTDIVKYASRDIRHYQKKLNPDILELLELVAKDINSYYELFYKYDKKKIVEINNNRYYVESELKSLSENIKVVEVVVLSKMAAIQEVLLDLIEARTALEY